MKLVPYRLASILLAWGDPDTGLYLVWPQEENPRGERRRSQMLNPEGPLQCEYSRQIPGFSVLSLKRENYKRREKEVGSYDGCVAAVFAC